MITHIFTDHDSVQLLSLCEGLELGRHEALQKTGSQKLVCASFLNLSLRSNLTYVTFDKFVQVTPKSPCLESYLQPSIHQIVRLMLCMQHSLVASVAVPRWLCCGPSTHYRSA